MFAQKVKQGGGRMQIARAVSIPQFPTGSSMIQLNFKTANQFNLYFNADLPNKYNLDFALTNFMATITQIPPLPHAEFDHGKVATMLSNIRTHMGNKLQAEASKFIKHEFNPMAFVCHRRSKILKPRKTVISALTDQQVNYIAKIISGQLTIKFTPSVQRYLTSVVKGFIKVEMDDGSLEEFAKCLKDTIKLTYPHVDFEDDQDDSESADSGSSSANEGADGHADNADAPELEEEGSLGNDVVDAEFPTLNKVEQVSESAVPTTDEQTPENWAGGNVTAEPNEAEYAVYRAPLEVLSTYNVEIERMRSFDRTPVDKAYAKLIECAKRGKKSAQGLMTSTGFELMANLLARAREFVEGYTPCDCERCSPNDILLNATQLWLVRYTATLNGVPQPRDPYDIPLLRTVARYMKNIAHFGERRNMSDLLKEVQEIGEDGLPVSIVGRSVNLVRLIPDAEAYSLLITAQGPVSTNSSSHVFLEGGHPVYITPNSNSDIISRIRDTIMRSAMDLQLKGVTEVTIMTKKGNEAYQPHSTVHLSRCSQGLVIVDHPVSIIMPPTMIGLSSRIEPTGFEMRIVTDRNVVVSNEVICGTMSRVLKMALEEYKIPGIETYNARGKLNVRLPDSCTVEHVKLISQALKDNREATIKKIYKTTIAILIARRQVVGKYVNVDFCMSFDNGYYIYPTVTVQIQQAPTATATGTVLPKIEIPVIDEAFVKEQEDKSATDQERENLILDSLKKTIS